MAGLTFDQRCALLRRLRDTLILQRERLLAYYHLLEQEEQAIVSGDVDRLERYVEVEQEVLRDLEALKRVLDPLEAMYATAFPAGESEIPPLRDSIERLRTEIFAHNEKNRELLREGMKDLRLEISLLKKNRPHRKASFTEDQPALIDLQA